MKATLKYIALFFAASLPLALAAQSIGLNLPSSLDATTLFAGFVAAFVLLTVLGDYSRRNQFARKLDAASTTVGQRKAEHPLAA